MTDATKEVEASVNLSQAPTNFTPILRTALASLINEHGERMTIRVLMDSGSTTNLIQRHVAAHMALQGDPVYLQVNVAGGKTSTTTKEKNVTFYLESLDGKWQSEEMAATTMNQVVKPLQPKQIDLETYPQTRGIQLIDPPTNKKSEIHLLLGEPYFSQYTIGPHVMGGIDEPGVVNTVFGFVLCGAQPEHELAHARVLTTIPNDISFLWEMDRAGIEDESHLTVEEAEVEDFMAKNTHYNKEEKRYYTCLPWKLDPKEFLDNNFERAKAICLTTARRNAKQVHLVQEAFQQLRKYNFAEEVPTNEIMPTDGRFFYYLETHAVVRPERETTKARLVMNAAAKDRETKKSLNDCLYTGRNLINLIPEVLIRFRQFKYGLVVDISKMFHNVAIKKESKDRDAVRYLQPEFDENGSVVNIKIMRHTALPFGLTSSPYQAIYVLQHHLEKIKKENGYLSHYINKIQRGMYVDDTVISASTPEEIRDIVETMKKCFGSCSMQFHKALTNNNELLLCKLQEKDLLQKSESDILGLHWDATSDTLSLIEAATTPKKENQETKRAILSQLASIHDVLGLSGPFVIRAKLLMQEVWERKCDWDDPVPEDLQIKYQKWKSEIPLLKDLKIPRWIKRGSDDNIYIASFGDSSLNSYAAVTFLVIKAKAGETESHLIMSKSRVAPKKLFKVKKMKNEKLTITRLELCGQVLNSKLAEFVRNTLNLPKENVHLFCDSKVTLGRLQQGPYGYCQYVGNRIRSCLNLFPADQFHYIDTKENPADLSTRGETLTSLLKATLWWHGPHLLSRPVEEWQGRPLQPEDDKDINNIERIKKLQIPVVLTILTTPELDQLQNKTNSWGKLCRIIAYVRRFINNSRHQLHRKRKFQPVKAIPPVGVDEIYEAEEVWLKQMQAQSFQEEISNCIKGESIKTSLKDALPFLDSKGLLRQNSRVKNNPYLSPTPIILAKGDRLTEKLVLHYHQLMLHAPAETVYCFLRRRFLLQGGRRELKRILHLCKNKRCRPLHMFKVRESTLPPFRVDHSEPFLHSSFDICGPCQVKHKCDLKECPHPKYSKAYIGVFCCNSTRYIHVEALEDMTAKAVLAAFERFFGRRGMPISMITDQGRQIVSVKKELEDLWARINTKKIQEEIAPRGIKWHLTNVYAPNENSLAESSVKLTKTSLLKTFKHGHLSFRDFETALIGCEVIINQRPLGYLREDSNELLPVSPCDLLCGRKLSVIPEDHRKETKKTTELSRMMKHRQRLITNFWRRFDNDYLENLSYFRLWRENRVSELQPGAVCQIIDKLSPRGKFVLGIVTEVHRGRDGHVRAATLRLTSGATTRRNIRQLALFETVDKDLS